MRKNHSSIHRARRIRFEILESRCMLSAPGDYDGNGMINANDYTTWRTNFGDTVAHGSGADGNHNGAIDAADYVVWRKNVGGTGPVDSINISIDGLAEAVEQTPGAIIWRNNDFSKQSLAAMQPEAGEPLYVPDYLAPSSIFDPASATDFTDASISFDADMLGRYNVRFTFDTAKVRLWTTTQWTGMTAVGGGLFQIPTGVTLTPAASSLGFLIEGLANSTGFATDSILVEAIPTAGGATLSDSGRYTVVETAMGVDGNRDTQIEFDNSHDRRLLFWVNNDQEGFNESDPAIESEEPNVTDPDHNDNVIEQRRDLEDLAPLRLHVNPLLFSNAQDVKLGAIPPGQLSVRYSLDFLNADGESFRLFYANNLTADVYRHVNNEATATVQATDPAFRNSERSAFTGNHILENTLSGLNPYLFEIRHGTLPYGTTFQNDPILVFLTEVFYPNGTSSEKRHQIDLDIRDIKSFYTSWDIPFLISGTDLRTDVSFQHFVTPAAPTHMSQVLNEPFFSGDDTTVLVHGWNVPGDVNNDWKAAFAETMYKRLYWQGYRGEFAAFNWPTFSDSEGPDWPIFGEGANITYNASDFQAYRAAQALRDILEDYREPSNLQPVHLLAHSMGNIVAGEALRQWAVDPNTVDALVTNYIAMEAAVSAGAYGDNGTDSRIVGRPIPDLYRFFEHGRDGFSDPGLGVVSYFQPNGFSSENRVNYYNEQDFALNLWDINNASKDPIFEFPQSPLWPYDYEFTEGDGENINNDTFLRNPDVGPDVILDLALPNGQPGPNAYEILAFFSQSASLALGTKPVTVFDANFDLESLGMLGGSDSRANHSYQFNHDAAETWGFYTRLKADLGFEATYSAAAVTPAIVSTVTTADETSQGRLDWFLDPSPVSVRAERTMRTWPTMIADGAALRSTPLRPALIDAYFETLSEDVRSTIRRELPSPVFPESLDLVFESLQRLVRSV